MRGTPSDCPVQRASPAVARRPGASAPASRHVAPLRWTNRGAPPVTLSLDEFRPEPAVVRAETILPGPSVSFIDAHNHLGRFGGGWDERAPEELFAHLEANNCVHY